MHSTDSTEVKKNGFGCTLSLPPQKKKFRKAFSGWFVDTPRFGEPARRWAWDENQEGGDEIGGVGSGAEVCPGWRVQRRTGFYQHGFEMDREATARYVSSPVSADTTPFSSPAATWAARALAGRNALTAGLGSPGATSTLLP